jgi:PPM family protein phosphatase
MTLKSAAATDAGKRRKNNEDRFYTDPERGIYAVIDGVGGQAAGEHAAECAVDVIRERLERPIGTPEDRLREAIALANNEIYRLSLTRTEWNGMACVLTIALIEDGTVTVGHVGDSRLYLLRRGEIEKITRDHSPVGEREDRGELSEAEAMTHARRNEIYRDVGSAERNPDDPSFIEISSFPMPVDGALLLCSDGLTDLVSASVIRSGVERYAPNYEKAIQGLIDAANAAGGKDNITVVIVASPGYATSAAAGARKQRIWPVVAAGLAIGIVAGAGGTTAWNRAAFASGPRTLTVGPEGINAALNLAHSGDTVIIPQGSYRERIELREGVTLRSVQPGTVTLTSPDGGPVIVARKIVAGTLEGVWVQGGVRITDASPVISNVRVTGADTGVEIAGVSAPLIVSSQITNNLGAGISVAPEAKPRIENNLIAANGNNGKQNEAKPGVEVADKARPLLKNNGIVDNAAQAIWIHGLAWQPADFDENFFGGLAPKAAIKLVDVPEKPEKPEKPGGKK